MYKKIAYTFGKISAIYITFKDVCGLCLVPSDMVEMVIDNKIAHNLYPNFGHCMPMPMADVAFADDGICRNFSAGEYMHTSSTAVGLRLINQNQFEDDRCKKVCSFLQDKKGAMVEHVIQWNKNETFLRMRLKVTNSSQKVRILEAIPSFQICGISPFMEDNDTENIIITELKSHWSSEGRMNEESADKLSLYDSWSHYGMRGKRIGQRGSMPARGNLPFLAVTDKVNNVTWASSVLEGGSWQMEVIHNTNALSISGGLADYNFGHWRKKLAPNESFESNEALVVCLKGSAHEASQSLLEYTKATYMPSKLEEDVPIIYNEYLTTWGQPTMEKLKEIIPIASKYGSKYFVMDAGWYVPLQDGCWESVGDWQVCNKRFPLGLKEFSNEVKKHKMVAGIWYEFESVSLESEIYKKHPEWLLTKDGEIVCHGNRMFFDFRKQEVIDYLSEKLIKQLNESEIGYLKVDYNENIGIGVDGAESFGEGLREHLIGVENFFKKIKESVPNIVIEMCSSGGMRHTYSWLGLGDMCSFSDEHFGPAGVPIAMGLHRFIAMEKLQIWAEMKAEHPLDYFIFTLNKGMLGRLCLSGPLQKLNQEQSEILQKGLEFYNNSKNVIRNGKTINIIDESKDLNKLDGKTFVLEREFDCEKYIYVFTIDKTEQLCFDLQDYKLVESFGNATVKESKNTLCVCNDKCKYGSVVLHLKK